MIKIGIKRDMISRLLLLLCVSGYRVIDGFGDFGIGDGGCTVNGKFYPDGAEISRDKNNCYGSICSNGARVAWDGKCSFMTPACPGGTNVWVDGQCCPNCVTSTTPLTTSPASPNTTLPVDVTTLDLGCQVNGEIYPYGTTIQNEDRCEKCLCSKGKGLKCESVACSGVDSNGLFIKRTDRLYVLNYIIGIMVFNYVSSLC